MVGGSGRTISELSAALDSEIGPYRSARVDLPLSPEEQGRLGQLRASPPDSLAIELIALRDLKSVSGMFTAMK